MIRLEKQIFEMLDKLDKKADDRHAEVLERLNMVDNRLNGIASQFEQVASDRITDNDFTNHKLNVLEKEIFQLKKVQ